MDSNSAQRELFLDFLFNDPECDNNPKLAAEKAGYSKNYHTTLINELSNEIMKRASSELAARAPKAVSTLVNTLTEDGSTPKGELRLKGAESILDRIGISKKQEVNFQVEEATPLFFIPAKAKRED